MRVTFDDQIFIRQRAGGISRYFAEMGAAMPAEVAVNYPLVSRNKYLIDAGISARLPLIERYPVGLLRTINRLRGIRAADLLHHTFYDERYLRIPARKRVVTIHDMIPELGLIGEERVDPHAGKWAHIEAADIILCVSETTKRDLLRFHPQVRVPTLVTPLGVSRAFRRHDGLPMTPLPERFIVFVGQRGGYKSFSLLLDALLLVESLDLAVVCVGGGPPSASEMEQMEASRVTGRVCFLQGVSDDELSKIYARAVALAMPTTYEGFGLPVLEALASGCPVIVSDAPVFAELHGDVVLRMSSREAGELASAIDLLLQNRQKRSRLVADGLEHARKFSWERTAALTSAAYERVLRE